MTNRPPNTGNYSSGGVAVSRTLCLLNKQLLLWPPPRCLVHIHHFPSNGFGDNLTDYMSLFWGKHRLTGKFSLFILKIPNEVDEELRTQTYLVWTSINANMGIEPLNFINTRLYSGWEIFNDFSVDNVCGSVKSVRIWPSLFMTWFNSVPRAWHSSVCDG